MFLLQNQTGLLKYLAGTCREQFAVTPLFTAAEMLPGCFQTVSTKIMFCYESQSPQRLGSLHKLQPKRRTWQKMLPEQNLILLVNLLTA